MMTIISALSKVLLSIIHLLFFVVFDLYFLGLLLIKFYHFVQVLVNYLFSVLEKLLN